LLNNLNKNSIIENQHNDLKNKDNLKQNDLVNEIIKDDKNLNINPKHKELKKLNLDDDIN